MTVGLYDPAGTSREWLAATGVQVRSVNQAAEAQGCPVLVIGRQALAQAGLPFSLADLPSGVKVLILEQDTETLEGLGLRSYPIIPRNCRLLVADHPAFAGLAEGDLSYWRVNPTLLPPGPEPLRAGYAYHWGNWGGVASVVMEKPTRGPFTPLTQSGFDLNSTALMEATLFGRQLMFCQMSLVDGHTTEPAAAILSHNLLRYLAQARPGAAPRQVVSGSELAAVLLADLGVTPATEVPAERALYLLGSDTRSDALVVRVATQAVAEGATAVCIMPSPELLSALPVQATGQIAEHRHFPVALSEELIRGLGVSDFHYRNFFQLMTFTSEEAGAESWASGAVLSVPQGQGRWVLVGFDPKAEELNRLRFRHSRRHTYRCLAQILTNLGAQFAPVEAVMAQRLSRPRSPVALVNARWYQQGIEAAAAGWQQPDYDDSSWTYRRQFGKHHVSRVGVFRGAQTYGPHGHYLLRAHVEVPAALAGEELLLSLPGMDIGGNNYWFNGYPLTDLYRQEARDPEQAVVDEGRVFNGIPVAANQPYNTPIACPLAAEMVNAGGENVLTIEMPGRYYDIIHNPMQISLRDQHPLYVGPYYPNDDPYFQRGF